MIPTVTADWITGLGGGEEGGGWLEVWLVAVGSRGWSEQQLGLELAARPRQPGQAARPRQPRTRAGLLRGPAAAVARRAQARRLRAAALDPDVPHQHQPQVLLGRRGAGGGGRQLGGGRHDGAGGEAAAGGRGGADLLGVEAGVRVQGLLVLQPPPRPA